jgi:NCS1 family nucleobase:cation symporter-1
MDRWSYLLAWLGGCVSIGTFAMGASLVGQLSGPQAALAMVLGCTVIALALTLNGVAGHRHGIPFMVQARPAFGMAGTRVPGLVRAVPALVWYGFQSWVGAAALNTAWMTLTGQDHLVAWFIAFQGLQVALSVLGFQGIKWLENVGSVVIVGALAYMAWTVTARYGWALPAPATPQDSGWGLPYWGGSLLFLGIYSTMMLNVGDYTRELQPRVGPAQQVLLYLLAIVPVTLVMGLIGWRVSAATGTADPVAVFVQAVDNRPLLVVTLVFIAFAQVTTNVLNNVLPPAYVLMDMFRLSFRAAVVLVGLLAMGTFPWLLVQDGSAAGLQWFVRLYSAFLGPIFAILVVDYHLLRRGQLHMAALYDANGPYRGVNWAGVLATLVGAGVALCFPLVGWYAGLLPAALLYWGLMRRWAPCQRFLGPHPAGAQS